MTARVHFTGIALVAALSLLAGCGGKTVVESDLRIKGAPDWVNEGTNILEDRGGRLFHGVGSAPALGDQSLQVATADDRARAELARIVSSYVEVLSQDYLASAGTGEGQMNEQAISRNIRNHTQVNLAGARIIGRWRDQRQNVVYSLAELDLGQVKEILGKMRDMNADFHKYVRDNADNIFDRVSEGGR